MEKLEQILNNSHLNSEQKTIIKNCVNSLQQTLDNLQKLETNNLNHKDYVSDVIKNTKESIIYLISVSVKENTSEAMSILNDIVDSFTKQ